jgi:hypothetical protein
MTSGRDVTGRNIIHSNGRKEIATFRLVNDFLIQPDAFLIFSHHFLIIFPYIFLIEPRQAYGWRAAFEP